MAKGRGGLREVLKGFAKRAVSSFLVHVAVGNVGAGEDDLQSVSLPALSLKESGDYVRIRAWGIAANNANAKTLKAYFGTQVVLNLALTASIAGKWFVDVIVSRTGKDTQDWVMEIRESTAAALAALKQAQDNGTATQDEDAAITVKLTGTGVATDDIVQEGMIVEVLRIPT